MTEHIKFELTFSPILWDKPPHAQIYVDNDLKFEGFFLKEVETISFQHILSDGPHQLKIIRSNKTNDQSVSEEQDQKLILKQLKIDGIDIRNIVWHYSYYEPKYPQPWALYQQKAGIPLEKKVKGETYFNHNGTWYLNFTSPFYMFIFDWMKDRINDN